MLYISPVQETVVGGGFTLQVSKWASSLVKKNATLSSQIKEDVKEVQKNWIPEKKQENAGGDWVSRQGGGDLSKSYRRKRRIVIGYNDDNKIAIYARFSLNDNWVKLEWIVGNPVERVKCGEKTAPLRSMLAFMAVVGRTKNLPVKLNADTHKADVLVPKYRASGWELTGKKDGSGTEMILKLAHINRPLVSHKPQKQDVNWKYSGQNTLKDYLNDGKK